jgi:hypothetical protein
VNGTGPERREGFLDSAAIGALLRDPGSFDPASVRDFHQGMPAVRTLTLGPGEALTDLLPEDATAGFLLDLDPPGWRSEWGGLLLFQDGERLHGYRPVPGALTLFPAATRPLISLITPQGRRRTSILGWWN